MLWQIALVAVYLCVVITRAKARRARRRWDKRKAYRWAS
jgi:hypothetical protein